MCRFIHILQETHRFKYLKESISILITQLINMYVEIPCYQQRFRRHKNGFQIGRQLREECSEQIKMLNPPCKANWQSRQVLWSHRHGSRNVMWCLEWIFKNRFCEVYLIITLWSPLFGSFCVIKKIFAFYAGGLFLAFQIVPELAWVITAI